MQTEKSMRYFVTYFDRTGKGAYLPLLCSFFEYARKAGVPPECFNILTDERTHPSLKDFAHVGKLIVAPHAFADLMRPGNHFDYKSALICAALPLMPANSVILDCDMKIQHDPTDALFLYTFAPFAMPPDSGGRTIPWIPPEWAKSSSSAIPLPEHSSSVLVFGDSDPGIRGALVDNYRSAWNYLAHNDTARGLIDDIREQRAWSLVHYWTESPLLAAELNWSAYHWQQNAEAFMVHHHGAKKFKDFA